MDLEITEDSKSFRDEIMGDPGTRRLMSCYQCGTCTSDCPIANRVSEFRPRQIARLAMYGQEDRLLGSDLLWLCTGCYTCYEHCPQEVHVSEIVSTLRRMSLRKGIIHGTFKSLMDSITELGYIYEIGEFENLMREDDGLPMAPEPDVDEIRKILEKTGFSRLMEES
jgi:heterodisulfide reductase subunit C